MKIFTNKKAIIKMIAVLAVLLIFSFILPNFSHAESDGDGGIGGALFQPILDLLVGLADWVMSFLQQAIFGMNETFIHIDRGNEFWSTFWAVVTTVVVVAACVAISIVCGIVSGGTSVPATVAAFVGAIGSAVRKCNHCSWCFYFYNSKNSNKQ